MWTQLAAAGAGIALMASPSLFGYGGSAADFDHIAGPVVASIGIMAASDVLRPLRKVNLVIAGAIAVSLLLERPLSGAMLVLVAALVVGGCSLLSRGASKRFGGGWSSVWRDKDLASDNR